MLINNKKFSLWLNCFARPMQNNRGFTLVELVIVTAILGILAATTLITISDFKDKTKIARASAEIRGLEKDIFAYASEKGNYPSDENVPGMENLKTLKDPWKNNYVYTLITNPLNPATRTWIGDPINTDFDLYSKGPTGIATVLSDPSTEVGNGKDDIIRGDDGTFVGSADKYLL